MADKPTRENKGGRPKLENGVQRDKALTIKFNAFEMEYITISANEAGLKTAIYCREVLLGNHVKARGKSSVRCPLKPSDSIPLCPNNPAH